MPTTNPHPAPRPALLALRAPRPAALCCSALRPRAFTGRKSEISNLKSTRPRVFTRAFTLAESLIAAVVLALSVLAVGGVLAAASQQAGVSQEKLTAISLARELMEEIAAKPLADPLTGDTGPGTEASASTRASFNNIGDYAGYSDNTDNLKDRQGNSIPFYGGTYVRTVTVTWYALATATPGDPITWTTPSATVPADAALVTVTVRPPSGQSLSITRLAMSSALAR